MKVIIVTEFDQTTLVSAKLLKLYNKTEYYSTINNTREIYSKNGNEIGYMIINNLKREK